MKLVYNCEIMVRFCKEKLLLLCVLLSAGELYSGFGTGTQGKLRVHYIGIGQDVLFTLSNEPVYSDYACSDVNRVQRHLLKKAGGKDSFHGIGKCGKISKKEVLEFFQEINQVSRADDYFVFYYGGYTHKVKSGDKVFTAFFISPPEIKTANDTLTGLDPATYFTIADLRLWMNALPPRKQIVLIEAGFTNELKSEFSRMLVESDEQSSILENRNRVLIFPQGIGIEDRRLKSGRFTWTMTNGLDTNKWNILDVFSEKRTDEFEYACWRSFVEVNKDGINAGKGINLIKEWELQALVSPTVQARLRGDNVYVSAPRNSENTGAPPRFFAFLCATDDYKYLSPLSNPVYDAETLDGILRNKYGFHTKLIKNPVSMEEFRKKLQIFTDSVQFGPRDELLVFIAGHGQYNTLDQAGYISFGNSHKDMVSEMQEQKNLLNILDNRPCKKIMLILDVCFGGLISQGLVAQSDPRLCNGQYEFPKEVWPFRGPRSQQIAKYLNCANRVYFTAGGYEYVSDGTPGAHSPFATALIDVLNNPADDFLLGDEIITRVKKKMGENPAIKQMPTSGRFGLDNNSTDFVFIRKH